MWYIQVDNTVYKMVQMNSTKWKFEIPENDFDILYISNNAKIEQSYIVTVKVGMMTFNLGILDKNNDALQSEPNFPIQETTKVTVFLQQQMIINRH